MVKVQRITETITLEKTSKIIKLPKYSGWSNMCTVKNSDFSEQLNWAIVADAMKIHEDKKLFKIWKKKTAHL